MGLVIIQKPANHNGYMQSRVWLGNPYTVAFIVIHTEQGFETGTDSWFANPDSHVSAHYSVGLNGDIHQHVSEGDTAYHAGNFMYNLRSIGIEFEDQANPFGVQRTDAQYEAGAEMIASICLRLGVELDRAHIIGHREVPGNNHPNCPGNESIDRLVQRAQQILMAQPGRGGGTPAPQPGEQVVTVTLGTLRVHTGPDSTSPVVTQPNPDGNLHEGQTFIMSEAVIGQDVNYSATGGAHTNQWLKSNLGHFVWAGGTNYPYATTPIAPPPPPPPPPAPTPPPSGGTVTVTASPALMLRTGPGTNYGLANGTDGNGHPINKLLPGTLVHYVKAVQGQSISGNPYWLVSVHGNYFAAAGTNWRRPGGRLANAAHAPLVGAYAVVKRVQHDTLGKLAKQGK